MKEDAHMGMDMLVRLYDVQDDLALMAKLKDEGILIKKAWRPI